MSSPELGKNSRRGALIPTIVALLVIGYLFTTFAQLWTDNLWYSKLGYGGVFSTQLWTSVGLFLGFGTAMGAAVALTIFMASRAA